MQDERELMRAAGFTEAEINAELGPPRPSIRRPAAESTGTRATIKNATPEQVAANRQADASYAVGLLRQGAQVATAGFADEIEGGVRSVVQGRPYREARDQVRSENDAFAQEYPVTTLAANVLGGVATGMGAARLAQAPGMIGRAASVLAPRATATASLPQRMADAARIGGVTGAVGGAGVAEEMGDVIPSAVAGGIIGGTAGGVLTAGGEMVRGLRNSAAQIGRQQGDPVGPVRRVVQAETPEVAGGRRALRAIGAGGQTLDDIAARSATAPRPTALAELVDDDQGVRALRIARNTGRQGGVIDRSLAERAADEPARFAEAIARNTGVPEGLDAKTVANQAVQRIEQRAVSLWNKSYQRPDVSAAPILRDLEKAARSDMGRMALRRASELSDGFDALQNIDPSSPTISVQNLHFLRQGYDRALKVATETGDDQMVAVLGPMRDNVDRLFKRAGGKLAQRADRLWEKAMTEGESFALGERSQTAQTKGAMVRMKSEARDPEAFRRGAASKQLARVESVQDGAAGQTRNPTVSTMGSPAARARASLGYENAGRFRDSRTAADEIVQRLQTRNAVSGNSATARNLAEMSDEFMSDPAAMAGAAINPTSMPRLLAERVFRAAGQGLNAQQADEMGRLLGAGLPGQMSRDEALRRLRELEPAITRLMARQATVRGAVGGATGRGAAGFVNGN